MSEALVTRGYIIPVGTGGGGSSVPVFANVSPPASADITPTTPVQFDVTDVDNPFAFIGVEITIDPNAAPEVVHDFQTALFSPIYAEHSTRVAITNGYRYTILRDGGWAAVPKLKVIAIDTAGNKTVGP